MSRFRVAVTAVALIAFGLGASPMIPGQPIWTFDGGGVVDSQVGPLPGWNTGRAYLVDRLDANFEARQDLGAVVLDYGLAGYFRTTSERETSGDLTRLDAALTLHGFPGSGGVFRASLGRVPIADPSGFVFRQPGDGLSLGASIPGFSADLSVGYLGLLLKSTNKALLTPADISALADPSIVLAPSRGVGLLTLSFPELIFRTDFELWGMYLLGMGSLPAGRWYAGLSETGPIWGPLSQRFDGVTGAELGSRLSLLTRFRLRADLPLAASSRTEGEFLYASGDSPSLSAFEPLTGDTAGVILATPFQNLFRVALRYSVRPFAQKGVEWLHSVEPFLASRWYFRQSFLPPAAVGYDPPAGYYGTELEAGIDFQHGTDPELSVSGGFFADAAAQLQWFGRASVILDF